MICILIFIISLGFVLVSKVDPYYLLLTLTSSYQTTCHQGEDEEKDILAKEIESWKDLNMLCENLMLSSLTVHLILQSRSSLVWPIFVALCRNIITNAIETTDTITALKNIKLNDNKEGQ